MESVEKNSARARANRKNALLSTGPRSEAGKRAIRGNAVRHGLCSEKAVLLDECEIEFRGFRDALWRSLGPDNPVQEFLAERIILGMWRLRRAHNLEWALLEEGCEKASRRRYQAAIKRGGVGLDSENPLAEAFAHVDSRKLDVIGRHEVRWERSVLRWMRELQALQMGRQTTMEVDVTVTTDGTADDPFGFELKKQRHHELPPQTFTEFMEEFGPGNRGNK